MILLDNCVPRRYVGILQALNHRVEVSIDHIPSDAPDADVIALAQKLDAVLISVDMDFANILQYPPQNYNGIVVLRYQPDEEVKIDTALTRLLMDLTLVELRGTLVVVTPGKYRIRRETQA
jgi:predicted nuclease of predicted toxin-antitoxin system